MLEKMQSYDIFSYCEINPYFASDIPSWVLDWRVPLSNERSILSILDPTEATGFIGRTNNLFMGDGHKLSCIGTIIRVLQAVSPIIKLDGRDEDTFQKIKEDLENDAGKINQKILAKWAEFPWLLDGRMRKSPIVVNKLFADEYPKPMRYSLLNLSKDSPHKYSQFKLSIEGQLIKRSRKTAFGTNDESLATSTIIDQTSIIDRRTFAFY